MPRTTGTRSTTERRIRRKQGPVDHYPTKPWWKGRMGRRRGSYERSGSSKCTRRVFGFCNCSICANLLIIWSIYRIVLSESIIASLSSEINRLREDDLYEQTLLRGSRAGLEPQPSTNDIDTLMRSMMGPSMDIGSQPYMGRNSLLQPQRGRTTGAGIVDGPWNNFGQPYVGLNFDRRDTLAIGDGKALQSSTTSTSTIGKRSRNGASKITRRGEEN